LCFKTLKDKTTGKLRLDLQLLTTSALFLPPRRQQAMHRNPDQDLSKDASAAQPDPELSIWHWDIEKANRV
jgi:hypothetical protein